MKKIYKMENLDCANCAAKMENKISKISGVEAVTVNFFAQKMILEIEDGASIDEILENAKKCVAEVDSDCEILG